MKILEIKVMRGPNYWSNYRNRLIVMKLDLEEMEEKPSDEIPGFTERLLALIPTLKEHGCSYGKPGGLIKRLEEGTWMGHVIEHVALELQSLAGMHVGFGRTRGADERGVYYVVFSYEVEEAGIFAGRMAFQLIENLIADKETDLKNILSDIKDLKAEYGLGPSTGAIVYEAERRGIPWIRLDKSSLIQLGYGVKQKRIRATTTSQTSSLAEEIAKDKVLTKNLLKRAGIPVPNGVTISSEEDLEYAIQAVGFPLVIKPVDGNHGRGITADITSIEQARHALSVAQEVSSEVIVESFIKGADHRLLLVNYKLVAVALRNPACVTGDGKSTIIQLIDEINSDPKRGDGHNNVLTKIDVDDDTLEILNKKNLTLRSILHPGEKLCLKSTANLSTGGTAEDVTDIIHPENVFLAERIARIIGLDICGIDLMTADITKPLNETNGAILEVNAGPGFRMHIAPSSGKSRNVAAPVIEMLFPHGTPHSIPLVAVTGTNGKTTTTRLIAHLAGLSGYNVGFTTTDGIYVHNTLIESGDCTGPKSTQTILTDPTVSFAVLECARGGLLRSGLAFDYCDVGIVTNVSGDHLGLGGINTLDQLARLKSVIPESVKKEGYAVLNADDDLVYEMAEELDCHIAFFSMDKDNLRIVEHCSKGGLAAIVEDQNIYILDRDKKLLIEKVSNIPLTFGGKAKFNVQNVLPAILTGYIRNFGIERIRQGIRTFIPSADQTPGRVNLFHVNDFKVLVDYAHNPAGLQALGEFVNAMDASNRVGIIAGVGDRRDEDLKLLGAYAVKMFDEIIIRVDSDTRGRASEEIFSLIIEGIRSVNPNHAYKIIPGESESLEYALGNAIKDSLIVFCCDAVCDALNFIKDYQEKHGKKQSRIEEESFN